MTKSLQMLLQNLQSLLRSISGEEDGGEAAKVDANRDAHVQHVDPAEVLSLLDKLTGQLSGSGGYPELSGPSNVNTRYLDCKTRTTTPAECWVSVQGVLYPPLASIRTLKFVV
ncbi:hypothetical protein Moror_3419 [Moniliophthora roreri MCA 2997]|uniref:Uncharacterized protein n=1 Tax=Moniliophthora roreri (strain MCA 2997) TaxID=1381753 RepID=V2WZ94_MONRO|nr:hypothetical protein Moror_3419 [Moniliophthora roreri MCA 2997]